MTRRSVLRGVTAAGITLVPHGPITSEPTSAGSAASGATVSAADFPLVAAGVAADLYVEPGADPAVTRVVADLRADIARVTTVTPTVRTSTQGMSTRAVLIGVIGQSPVIDALIARGSLDVGDVTGRWEASVTQVVEAPFAGVERALVIAGSDRRGAIYGVYDLSERIGVSPWYWWADVPVTAQSAIMLNAATLKRGEPAVRYRGIFLNDEDNLATWAHRTQETDKKIGPATYRRIFELLLRLKANYLWPAMHPESDGFNTYPDNPRLADEYGIVVGSSHPEALLRNNVHEWDPWAAAHHNSDGSTPVYDYTVNKQTILDYWRARARANARYESSWTIGMRGIHDSGLVTANATTTAQRVAVMNSIVTEQRKILSQEVNAKLTAVPQIFIPYKEVLDLYNAGVVVPDDVTLVWPDDNHGHLRQTPTAAEQARSGGNGLYYHISYWGAPKSYLWLDTTPLIAMWQELRRAYDHQVRRLWVINVGDLKSQELGTSFAMELAWNVDRWTAGDVDAFLVRWQAQQFGAAYAREIADIRTGYYQLSISRRPEFIGTGVFSTIHHGDEADVRLSAYRDLIARAQALVPLLPTAHQDALYELLLYPLQGAYQMTLKFYYADRNALAVKQGRGAGTNRYADLAQAAQTDEAALTTRYHTAIAGGKWDGIVNPYPTNVPKAPMVPAVTRLASTGTVGLGVASEGNETGVAKALSFSSYTRRRRFVDVFNTGFNALAWSVTTSVPWVLVSRTSGSNSDQIRLWVSIDWAKAPAGHSTPTVQVAGAGTSVTVPLDVTNDGDAGRQQAVGHVEAHGYVSIEAEHFAASVARGGASWQVVPGLGRRGDAVLAGPSTAASVTSSLPTRAPELRYDVQFTHAGTFTVIVYRLPSLDTLGARRVAIGLDGGAPTIMTGANKASGSAWERNVVEQIEKLTATITVDKAGAHVLHLWMVDAAIAVDQIVIDTGGLPASYLAPPESYHPVFNPNPTDR